MAELLPGVDRALVIGLSRSGPPAARALAAAGVEVVAVDRSEITDGVEELASAGVEVRTGVPDQVGVALVDGVDLIVPSPGVPERSPILQRASDAAVPVWSEPELGWRLAPRRIVGVTGTNGKTSVTELTAAILRAGGVDATPCGNLGHPFTEAALTSAPGATLVAELSSFQLRFAHTLRARVGVLLNLAPDHLDWHGDVASYGAAKARLWRAQDPGDWAVGNADDPPSAQLVREHARQQVAWFSTEAVPRTGVGVRDGRMVALLPDHEEEELVQLGELAGWAPHQVANAAAAACAALLAGAPASAVATAVPGFRPGGHRLEVVSERGGVTWVDDSKATNPHAAAAALRASSRRHGAVVWIAGGLAKGIDLRPLGAELGAVRHAVFIGDAAGALAQVADTVGVASTRATSIEEAVEVASRHARPGDVVLLAPACASFDQFRDYAERGERFAAAVRDLVTAERT